MNASNQNQTQDSQPNNNFDTLCQGFEGGNFYGLEYILDDFFENTTQKNTTPVVQHSVDWFGLYS